MATACARSVVRTRGSRLGRPTPLRGLLPGARCVPLRPALPQTALQNVDQGPAKDITFELSKPVRSSDGQVLSDLPFFAEGLTSLVPGAAIGCYWDSLDNLLPAIKEGKVASDITVTVRYKDLNLTCYEHEWDVNPRLYEGIKNVDYNNMNDLVEVVRKIAREGIGSNGKQAG